MAKLMSKGKCVIKLSRVFFLWSDFFLRILYLLNWIFCLRFRKGDQGLEVCDYAVGLRYQCLLQYAGITFWCFFFSCTKYRKWKIWFWYFLGSEVNDEDILISKCSWVCFSLPNTLFTSSRWVLKKSNVLYLCPHAYSGTRAYFGVS